MKKTKLCSLIKASLIIAAPVSSLLFAGAAQAVTISNGSLAVDIGANGAIESVNFGGSDFYNPGTSVLDFGFQIGTNTGTFERARTSGSSSFDSTGLTTLSGSTVSTTLSDNGIDFTREYSLVDGLDVLSVTTTVTNTTATDISSLRIFDTGDADQGVGESAGFRTFNDRVDLLDGEALLSSTASGLSTAWGIVTDTGGYSGGFGLGINSGFELNNFFNTGAADPNGSFADIGMAIGWDLYLAAGESTTITYYQAYGTNTAATLDGLAAAASVSEPASIALIAVGLAGIGLARRRKA